MNSTLYDHRKSRTSVMEVKWCGFDYGQCIMEPGGLRNPLVFGDICKELGKPEFAADKIRKYRILKEKYGTYSSIKEGHRDEIYQFVLDNDSEAIEIFGRKEQNSSSWVMDWRTLSLISRPRGSNSRLFQK